MLIKLDNGYWIDPNAVASVKATEQPDTPEGMKGIFGQISQQPQVMISLHGGIHGSQWCDSNEDAVDTADRIAGQINAAREARS